MLRITEKQVFKGIIQPIAQLQNRNEDGRGENRNKKKCNFHILQGR